MTEPLPTPYDIVDIPYFAFTPSLLAWLIVGALCIALIIAAKLLPIRRQKKLKAYKRGIESLKSLIDRLKTNPKDAVLASQAALLSRRLLGLTLNVDCSSMGDTELKNLSQDSPFPTARIIEGICLLDKFRYSHLNEVSYDILKAMYEEFLELLNPPLCTSESSVVKKT